MEVLRLYAMSVEVEMNTEKAVANFVEMLRIHGRRYND